MKAVDIDAGDAIEWISALGDEKYFGDVRIVYRKTDGNDALLVVRYPDGAKMKVYASHVVRKVEGVNAEEFIEECTDVHGRCYVCYLKDQCFEIEE